MNGARHDFLAGSAFTFNQDRYVGGGNLLDELADPLDGCIAPGKNAFFGDLDFPLKQQLGSYLSDGKHVTEHQCPIKGKHLILSAPHTQPLVVMTNSGFIERLGEENVCPDITAALGRARHILGLPPVAEMPEAHETLHFERETVDSARKELAEVLERAQTILRTLNRSGEVDSGMTIENYEALGGKQPVRHSGHPASQEP